MHHVVRSAEEVHDAADGWESLPHPALHRVLARKCCFINLRKHLCDNAPCVIPSRDENFLARITPILRDAWRTHLEVFIAVRHCELEVRSPKQFKDEVCVDREMADTERRVVDLLDGNLAEPIRGNTLHNLPAVEQGDPQGVGDDAPEPS